MTKQEYVQLISDKIDAGNVFPARDSINCYCFYGQENSTKHCFIGLLIPKNHPAMLMFGTVTDLIKKYPEFTNLIEEVTPQQLRDIQSIHDIYAINGKDFRLNKNAILEEIKTILQI